MTETTETQIISSGNGRPKLKLTRRKLLALGLLVLLGVALAVGYFIYTNQPKDVPTGKSNEEIFVAQLLTEKPGKDATQNAIHYMQLGTAYNETGDTEKALENYLKADTFIKDRSATASISVNEGIGYAYKDLGDKKKAKEYFQREIKRLESNGTVASESAQYIEGLKKIVEDL